MNDEDYEELQDDCTSYEDFVEDYEELQDDCTSYEDFVEDLISLSEDDQSPRSFIFEYAFEGITERGSIFRRKDYTY